MVKLRVALSVGLCCLAWWAVVTIGAVYEPGPWFLLVWFCLVLFGPAIAGILIALPAVRGNDVGRGGLAAATVPPAVFIPFVLLQSDSGDMGPAGAVLGMMFMGVVALAGGVIAWCTGLVVSALRPAQ